MHALRTEEDNRMAIQSLAEVFVAEFYIVGALWE